MVLLMPARSRSVRAAGVKRKGRRKRGVVVSISAGKQQPAAEYHASGNRPAISQDRLSQILECHKEELRITAELRELRLELERELMQGAQIEAGELFFDRDLRIVRRNIPNGSLGR